MRLIPRKNLILLIFSLLLIAFGFFIMKLESAPHGNGPWALTVAPSLILSGFVLGIVSIFYGSDVMKNWKGQRLILFAGWSTFLISFVVYILTLEKTASLWDCSEFIACAFKLQVPHAPGAPLFLMIGRFFSLFAFGDLLKVAYWVNVTSALSSAFVVMFTFWTVVMLGRKVYEKASNFSLIVAGMVGAFTIAFADSFWFSAAEAETYAMATLFLIIVLWSILKWEQKDDFNRSAHWFIFIFYAFGLSVGVHPITLLILPAIAIIIMFRYRKFTYLRLIGACALGAGGILFFNQIVLFGLPDAMKYFDIFFVNIVGLPFYSGAIIFIFLIVVTGFLLYRWSIIKKEKAISIFIIGMMYFLIGYSSYFMIIIRSQQNPSIDENNPENLMTLTSYLKRESYGGRPLFLGQNYTAKIASIEFVSPVYTKMEDSYQVTDRTTEYVYEKSGKTILPRMYSTQEKHIKTYQKWSGLKVGEIPNFFDNMRFMIYYQFGHMYFRYLMFNFSGRASDIQHAEWLSPLVFLDHLPDSLQHNKAYNNYLMLPFLLGLFGMYYQYRKDKAGFWTVTFFFLFLGLILVFYLNSPPNEPRERDYIYVGSYLAFAIWCGLGAFAVIQLVEEKFTQIPRLRFVGVLIFLIPGLMFFEGYDDHDRSGRKIQVDHARNTLASCAPNAILFTGGDNDTFPLWYVQEVEGFRTDVRVIVLSYFNADWYIQQMQRKIYESEALPFSIQIENYRQGGKNDILPYAENLNIKGAINLEKYLELIRIENQSLQVSMTNGAIYNSIPSRTFFMNVDVESVKNSGIVPRAYFDEIHEKLLITWSGNFMEKSALMVLDLIANNNWERPIYFNITSLNSICLNLKKHVLQEGLVYRLLPIQLEKKSGVDVDNMYKNLMEKSVFRDLENEDIYYNHEDYQLRILQSSKTAYNLLAQTLIEHYKYEKAGIVMDFFLANFYNDNIDLDMSYLSTIDILHRLGRVEQAIKLADLLYVQSDNNLEYYEKKEKMLSNEAQIQLYILRGLYDFGIKYSYSDLTEKCSSKFNNYISSQISP